MPSDQIVWITGASSGIGAEIAKQYSQRGARVILSARRREQLEEVKQACHQPDRHWVLPLDMADTESHQDVVAQALQMAGHVDIMIHNAGISQRALVKDTNIDVDRNIMEVNFFGTVSLTKAILPSMLQRKSGHFVVVSSLVGLFGTPLRSAYAASKHALHGFFESMQAEVWQDNIFVSMVCPGFIRTEISTKALTGDGTAHATLDPALASGMPPDVCARKIIQGIKQRKAQIVVGGKETMGVWVKRFFPALFRRTIRRVKVI